MEDKEQENKPAEKNGKVPPAPAAPAGQSATPTKPGPESKKGTSKIGGFFRALLIWLGVIAVAFLAGVGTYHFVRYVPLNKSLGEAQTALDEANSELVILRADKQKSDATISALQGELQTANAHVEILQLLADANEARLAILSEDVEGAKIALENSTETLNGILPTLSKIDADLAQSMSQRLGLILSELDRDSKAAQVDLELLTKDLLAAEEALPK